MGGTVGLPVPYLISSKALSFSPLHSSYLQVVVLLQPQPETESQPRPTDELQSHLSGHPNFSFTIS